MRTTCLLLTLIAATDLVAQDKPDFSGTWVLESPSAEMPQTLVIRQPLQRTTALGKPMPPTFLEVTVERHFESGVRIERYTIGTESGTVSGTVGNGRPGVGANTRVSVRWEGDRLHIDTRNYSGPQSDSGPYAEHDEVWRLDERGRLLIVAIERQSGAEQTSRTLTYRRR